VGHDNGSAVTIGAYDGIHIGHRQVIELVRRRASEAGLRSVVVTFDKNPAAVINPASAPPRLTDIDLKMELLNNTGVDQILVLNFDAERAKETAEDFVTEVLVGELNTRIVVVGEDFHFGNQRKGNVELLRQMGERAGFTVEPVHLVADEWAHMVVSSTRIRALIATGELAEAAALLGRPHEVRGVVVASEDGFEDRKWPSLFIDVPAEILLPPPRQYSGSVLTSLGKPVAARMIVQAHIGEGPQQIELSALNVPWSPLPVGRAKGDVVRVRFG
jgi:riboflavin kinase/FMN adenylyltransferase